MDTELPDNISVIVAPLLDVLPLHEAMGQLVVTRGASRELVSLVQDLSRQKELADKPALLAGLWLYVDELDRSHEYSQAIKTPTGSFWHGIMHRREGDFGNSHYWFRRAGQHPAMAHIVNYEPHKFIDDVEAAHRRGAGDDDALIDLQRREWATLLAWCAANG